MRATSSPASASGCTLEAVRLELAELRERIEALEQPRRRGDPAQDAAMLSALAHALGSRAFTAADLAATPDPELRAVLGEASARRIGAWLRRVRRQPSGPYRLMPIGRESSGVLWTLVTRGSAGV